MNLASTVSRRLPSRETASAAAARRITTQGARLDIHASGTGDPGASGGRGRSTWEFGLGTTLKQADRNRNTPASARIIPSDPTRPKVRTGTMPLIVSDAKPAMTVIAL